MPAGRHSRSAGRARDGLCAIQRRRCFVASFTIAPMSLAIARGSYVWRNVTSRACRDTRSLAPHNLARRECCRPARSLDCLVRPGRFGTGPQGVLILVLRSGLPGRSTISVRPPLVSAYGDPGQELKALGTNAYRGSARQHSNNQADSVPWWTSGVGGICTCGV